MSAALSLAPDGSQACLFYAMRLGSYNDEVPTSNIVEIRPARLDDARALTALWEPCGLSFVTNDVVSEMQACIRLHAELLMVATAGLTIAGSVWATYDGRRRWVQCLAVDPGFRGHGIGSALLIEAERRLANLRSTCS